MAIAVYPGTFDPITFGHVDLVVRAAKLFDQVIVAIAENQNKQPFFSFEKRIGLAREVLAHLPNVAVKGFNQLLVDFAEAINAQVIIRGVRAVSDFDYEFQLAAMNRQLSAKLETVFLIPAEQYAFLSSSMVKEIAKLGGSIDLFVPPQVINAFNEYSGK